MQYLKQTSFTKLWVDNKYLKNPNKWTLTIYLILTRFNPNTYLTKNKTKVILRLLLSSSSMQVPNLKIEIELN